MIKTALIFAAGRGERLRPITDKIPKSLCAVDGIPLIERLITQLAHAHFKHVVINHAYLGSKIKHHLQQKDFCLKISYSPEPPGALETGGGLVAALPLLGNAPFATISSDIFTDYPFENLSLKDNYPMHLVLVSKQSHTPHGDFGLDEKHIVVTTPKNYTFGNIACFNPAIFTDRTMRRFRLFDFLLPLIQERKASGEYYHGKWSDIGSVERLLCLRSRAQ